MAVYGKECRDKYAKVTQIFNLLSYTICKKNYLFQHFWVGFFLSKIPSIYNTNNTCNR